MRLPRASLWILTLTVLALFLSSACGDGESNPFAVKSELVIQADRPIALAFAPDGRLFYAEHLTGNIRVVTPDGTLVAEPFATITVATTLEWGLTGLAIDPDFETNHFIYAFYSEWVHKEPPITGRPALVRYTEQNNKGTDPVAILDDLPPTVEHHEGFNTNGSIHFGPDGFLYASIGDYDISLSQDLTTAAGKLLRVKKDDGSAPSNNPFVNNPAADPRIFAYGFRESFDFTFDPKTGDIYGSDNTPDTCEEINIIKLGGNYGWPNVGEFPWGDCSAGEQVQATHLLAKEGMKPGDFLSLVVATGKEFVSGKVYPVLGDSLLVCQDYKTEMRRLALSEARDQVTSDDVLVSDCRYDIATSPDGIIYYSNDKEIRRLIPQPTKTPEK